MPCLVGGETARTRRRENTRQSEGVLLQDCRRRHGDWLDGAERDLGLCHEEW